MPRLADLTPKPYWRSACGDYEVWMADCMAVLPTLARGSFGACVTDPPYGVAYQSNMRVKTDMFEVLANDCGDTRLLAYPLVHDLLRDDTVFVVFASWGSYAKDYAALSAIMDVKNVIVWDKGGGGIGDLAHSLSTDYELAVVAHKGRRRINGHRDGSVWSVGKVNPNDMVHATEKPVELMVKILNKWTDAGDGVLDPFAGSGVVGAACVETGRRYVGIEIDEAYCKVAVGRIQRAMLDRGLLSVPVMDADPQPLRRVGCRG